MYDPLVEIKNFNLVDLIRGGAYRKLGSCTLLSNTEPSQNLGERVRSGYTEWTDVTLPTGTKVHRTCPVSIPEDFDFNVFFATDSGSKVYCNPYFIGSTKQSGTIRIDESKQVEGTIAFPTEKTAVVSAASGLGLSATAGYYNGWACYGYFHSMTFTGYGVALITDYSYDVDADESTFTFVEDVKTGLGWDGASVNYFDMKRSNHRDTRDTDDNALTPTFNTDIANAPSKLLNHSGRIVFSGGQGSTSGLESIYIDPHHKVHFFQSVSGRDFTFEGTYAHRERLRSHNFANPNATKPFTRDVVGVAKGLETGYTYWFAYAPIYDGEQIGELYKYNSPDKSEYEIDNYLDDSTTGVGYTANIAVRAGTLNKRITGVVIYGTRVLGDASPNANSAWDSLMYVDFTVADNATWTWDATYQYYKTSVTITGETWASKGDNYVVQSGMSDITPDTSYSYSVREQVGFRDVVSNFYVTSETATDRESIISNPIQQCPIAGINGSLAYSAFSNEVNIFRYAILSTVGSKINGVVPININSIVVLKDRGAAYANIVDKDDGSFDLQITSLFDHDGCASLNGWCYGSKYNEVFFVGYQDIYALEGNNLLPLIEKPDKQDWRWTFRSISTAHKEASAIFGLPASNKIVVQMGNTESQPSSYNGLQYSFHWDGGFWRQIRFAENDSGEAVVSMKFLNRLQDGTVLATAYTVGGNPYVISFDATTFLDDDTSIVPRMYMYQNLISDALHKEFLWSEFKVNQTYDDTMDGQLDCSLYIDSTELQYEDLPIDKTIFAISPNVRSGNPLKGMRFSFEFNTNDTTPLVLDTGDQYQIDCIALYGELRDRRNLIQERSDVATLSTSNKRQENGLTVNNGDVITFPSDQGGAFSNADYYLDLTGTISGTNIGVGVDYISGGGTDSRTASTFTVYIPSGDTNVNLDYLAVHL